MSADALKETMERATAMGVRLMEQAEAEFRASLPGLRVNGKTEVVVTVDGKTSSNEVATPAAEATRVGKLLAEALECGSTGELRRAALAEARRLGWL